MCLKCFKVDSASPAGIRHSYVPCGVCEDCRRKLAQQWSFRINAEFLDLKKRGWNVAFCTLTYAPEHLPTIPDECFVNPDKVKVIPCFNRFQVRTWIDEIRSYCRYNFDFKGENRIRFFIASELGSLRHRPHYHALLAWPSSVSYKEMHAICTDYWHYGYLFPRDFRGDGKCLSFEVVGDASKVFTYCSKYACKDLTLLQLQSNSEFYSNKEKYEEDSPEMSCYRTWRNCQSFHIQSQSLGFEAIKNLSDSEKMRIYRYGMRFSSDEDAKPQQIPLYIKHKLVFDPYYVYDENGKRLVRKKANDFFLRHAHEIFDMKAEYYQKFCCSAESAQYLKDRGLSDFDAERISGDIRQRRELADRYFNDLSKDNTLGKMYLAYHRVNLEYCYPIELCHQWLLRYFPDALYEPIVVSSVWLHELTYLKSYWESVDSAQALLGSFCVEKRAKESAQVDACRDFFKNILK